MRLWHRLNRRFLIRYRIEYGIALFVIHLVRMMSPGFSWASARAIGSLLFRLGVRRKIVLGNLAIAFPEKSEAERRDIARRMYRHFGSMAVDVMLQRRMLNRRNVLDRVQFSGWAADYMKEYGVAGMRERSKRMLFLTAHLGNWEIGSGLFGLLGVRIDPVFRPPQNPFVDRLLRNIRLDSQFEFITKRGAVQQMMDRFDAGGNVGFLFDQEAMHGLDIPFFGWPARTHKTPAVLARQYGLKVFFGVVIRRGDYFAYEARAMRYDVPPPDAQKGTTQKEADVRQILTDLMERLEDEIRRCPEQYLWAHRRWKRSGVHGAQYMTASDRAAAAAAEEAK